MRKKKLSVLKRQRQNEKRRLLNYARKRKIKILTKKLYRLMNKYSQEKRPKEEELINTLIKEVEDLRNNLIQAIDKARKRGVLHRNTASRKKSKVSRKVAEFINSCKS